MLEGEIIAWVDEHKLFVVEYDKNQVLELHGRINTAVVSLPHNENGLMEVFSANCVAADDDEGDGSGEI
ncbi:hypothetical protein QJS10_CPA02g00356 [Acorus calamus]|uniref:Uncharacterized protein n=1 Tax=Acorus calamus TaxID=4465 RepID=A0AAV9F9T7_ACOCL|nr:hypothetical protein QJS10_CPA02g00356 [Acorus calamus]